MKRNGLAHAWSGERNHISTLLDEISAGTEKIFRTEKLVEDYKDGKAIRKDAKAITAKAIADGLIKRPERVETITALRLTREERLKRWVDFVAKWRSYPTGLRPTVVDMAVLVGLSYSGLKHFFQSDTIARGMPPKTEYIEKMERLFDNWTKGEQ